ncbi:MULTISPECIES: DUF6415 family natural product biosynthesis protein [unclassified Streptomyces]|uniref:DUF6415 family natural product biosynthesis protein n=1 Tax=unclassified Streptomyces TaxID=2593676 RepID=UPI0004C288DC|nr:DUF6415 family natural product biosynthesis protein [Streptomyces sp. NRRL S-1448]
MGSHTSTLGLKTSQAPIDVLTIEETIEGAHALRGSSPTTGELADFETLLRGHIALLLPDSEADAAMFECGSFAWSRRMERLNGIRVQSEQGLGDGRLSAHVQVGQLARDCQWLLDDYRERER